MDRKDITLNQAQHTLVVGPTGIGKTMRVTLPYLLSAIEREDTVIVSDAKNNLLDMVYGRLEEHGYNILTLNIRDPQNSNAWNPLSSPYRLFVEGQIEKCMDLLSDLATNIMADKVLSQSSDPFWTISARDLFIGLALTLFEDCHGDEEMVNLQSIYYMSTKGFERAGNSTYLHLYFKDRDVVSHAAINMSSTLTAPNETRGSIISVFNQKMKSFMSKNTFMSNLCTNEIDMVEISNAKTAVFLVYEDEVMESSTLINIFIHQLFDVMVKERTMNKTDNYRRCHIVFDDFTSAEPFYNLHSMIMSAQERNILMLFCINSFCLLEKLYGDYISDFLKNNCGKWIIFKNTELKFMRDLISTLRLLYPQLPIRLHDLNLQPGHAIVIEPFAEPVMQSLSIPSYTNRHYQKPAGNPASICKVFKIDEQVRNQMQDEMKNQIGSSSRQTNVDDLIAKIDQRIAELEKEEQESKQKVTLNFVEKAQGTEQTQLGPTAQDSSNETALPSEEKETDSAPFAEMLHKNGRMVMTAYDQKTGKPVELDVLFTFESDENKKRYIVYTDNTQDDDDNTRVYASILERNEKGEAFLSAILTDSELKMVEAVMETLQNKA